MGDPVDLFCSPFCSPDYDYVSGQALVVNRGA